MLAEIVLHKGTRSLYSKTIGSSILKSVLETINSCSALYPSYKVDGKSKPKTNANIYLD